MNVFLMYDCMKCWKFVPNFYALNKAYFTDEKENDNKVNKF